MLKRGDLIPDLSLPNENDQLVNLRSESAKSPLIIYFYPKDDTPGCTIEACTFRDFYNDFELHGVKVFGVSQDSPRSHRAFIKKHNLNFSLLTDKDSNAAQYFGLKRQLFGLLPGRTTYVFDKGGKLLKVISSAVNMRLHVTESLETIKSASLTD
jgi:thioredoxin-dependent peroxiredoxin